MSALRGATGAMLALLLSGCVNVYHRVDAGPEGKPMSFRGVSNYVKDEKDDLHVMQVHGMGDHSAGKDCAPESENLRLQDKIAKRLHYRPDRSYGSRASQDIKFDGTVVGSWSVAKYDDVKGDGGTLYFSCITWGETGGLIKRGMLQLDENFLEDNDNERHRAPINRWAKRFVNRSFADPVIYQGPMGAFIRRVVWEGMHKAYGEHANLLAMRANAGQAQLFALDQLPSSPPRVAIISDSMGSRIVFDAICSTGGGACGDEARLKMAPLGEVALLQANVRKERDDRMAERLRGSIRSVYMLANQLPLLELANLEVPPNGTSLQDWVSHPRKCYLPPLTPRATARDQPKGQRRDIQIVAFTDVNDALSYHLTPEFKARCARLPVDSRTSGTAVSAAPDQDSFEVSFINVTMPNAKPRWLFVYSDLVKAHSGGFKDNDRAIDYMVFGNP